MFNLTQDQVKTIKSLAKNLLAVIITLALIILFCLADNFML